MIKNALRPVKPLKPSVNPSYFPMRNQLQNTVGFSGLSGRTAKMNNSHLLVTREKHNIYKL